VEEETEDLTGRLRTSEMDKEEKEKGKKRNGQKENVDIAKKKKGCKPSFPKRGGRGGLTTEKRSVRKKTSICPKKTIPKKKRGKAKKKKVKSLIREKGECKQREGVGQRQRGGKFKRRRQRNKGGEKNHERREKKKKKMVHRNGASTGKGMNTPRCGGNQGGGPAGGEGLGKKTQGKS